MTEQHVVMFSGGIGSWATAKRVADQHGTNNMILLFADVAANNPNPHIGEDPDTYRFLHDAAANIGAELVTVADGRDIWQVFKDDRFLGNSRLANCSKLLKQKPSREWLDTNCNPDTTTVYVGIDWTESHRLPAITRAYLPYTALAPMTDPPYLDKTAMIATAVAEGLYPPQAYAQGYAHANCGGGCVRAGQGQFKKLLEINPERYAVWEAKEQELRDYLDKDVAILRDRTGGISVPITLAAFRERAADGQMTLDLDDVGGCGCFVEEGES